MANYNGWTNYATWRINLEIFDGMSPENIAGDDYSGDVWALENAMKEFAEEMICNDGGEGLARDYALAFISYVNWRELAEHKIQEYANV